jgi:hypothetical protein
VNKALAAVALTANPSPVGLGQPVTLSAVVSAVPPGAGTPTGSVTFQDGSTILGTIALAGGKATFSTSSLALGAHVIYAVYAGDAHFLPRTGGLHLSVTSAVALTGAPNPSVFGQTVTFTATLSPAAAGTVTFRDGATVLGTKTVGAGGLATLSTGTLQVGAHSISATYSGGTISNTRTQTVNKALAAVALTASPSPVGLGRSVTLSAVVSAVPPGAGTPTGSVTFQDGSTALSPLRSRGWSSADI